MKISTFVTHFADITDPRQLGKIEHKLFDIMLLTISAVISGAEGWEDIEMFSEERQGKIMKNPYVARLTARFYFENNSHFVP